MLPKMSMCKMYVLIDFCVPNPDSRPEANEELAKPRGMSENPMH